MPATHRRSFLIAAGATLAAPFVSRFPRARAAAFDPSFGTAGEALRALRSGAISSRELVAHVFARIKKYNPQINAFVTLVEEQAMERARQIDEARAASRSLGRLAGLPILLKDSLSTAGVRTTCGMKLLEKYVPKDDAVVVARLKAAGAILIGKTNCPEGLADVQSYNQIAGTSNNPYDTSRTPGGSTGGGAAALASGFGFLEMGSDIGGSIRTPCHFCGVYGIKPTLNLVPMDGHIPPPPGAVSLPPELPVVGPMARSAHDVLLELEVVAGPPPAEARAYRWRLPSPRGSRLRDYRMGYVLDDPFCPIGSDVKAVLARAVEALRKAGVELTEGWPKGYNSRDIFERYWRMLAAVMGPGMPPDQIQALRGSTDMHAKLWIEGMSLSQAQWTARSEARLTERARWQEYFRTHDAFLSPVNIVPAFPHNQKLTFFDRTVATAEGPRAYLDMIKWIVAATFTGCPAAVAPVGRTRQGLPVGIQIIGPYLEDATPIDIAGRLADVVGGFEPPPGMAA